MSFAVLLIMAIWNFISGSFLVMVTIVSRELDDREKNIGMGIGLVFVLCGTLIFVCSMVLNSHVPN